MELSDLEKFEEKIVFGYISSPMIKNLGLLMRPILQYDYTHSTSRDKTRPSDWSMKAVDDLIANLEQKPEAMVAVALDEQRDIIIRDFSTYPDEDVISVLRDQILSEVHPDRFGKVHQAILDVYLPNCNSFILTKRFSSINLMTKFSLRRFIYHTGARMARSAFMRNNGSPFMMDMLNDTPAYDYRFRTRFTWGNDETIVYYGKDIYSDEIVFFESQNHADTMYMAAAHKAFVRSRIDTYEPLLKIKKES